MLRGLLPILALLLGLVVSSWLEPFAGSIPYVIGAMLFFTFIGVSPRDICLKVEHLQMLLLQVLLSVVGYFALVWIDPLLASGAVVCLLIPVATATPTIMTALGGQVAFSTTFVLLAHAFITLYAPLVLPHLGGRVVGGFWQGAWDIFCSVSPLVLLPIALAWLHRRFLPRTNMWLLSHRQIPFALWLLSLVLLMAHTRTYIEHRDDVHSSILIELLALGAVVCVLQFFLGDVLASVWKVERHASRHCIGQKNTTLGIWLAMLYLDPLASLVVSGYIVMQNIMISYYLWKYKH